MHGFVAAARHTLPGFSTCLAFCCRSGAAGLKIIVQNFNVSCFRLSLRRGRTENHCPILQRSLTSVHEYVAAVRHTLPGFSPRLAFGCRSGAAGLKIIVQNFNASYFRLSLRRGRTENHCPKLQRALASVHGFVAATRHTLPGFSPHLAFGCRSGAAGQKTIARYFIAALLRCIDLSRLPVICCPDFHRALLSVVVPARPDRKSLPDTSTQPYFGA